MGIVEIFLLALGLSMDAFAVSVCKGLAMRKASLKNAAICGIWFGGFQALMPFIGYLLGASFESYVSRFAPIIAFVLLCLIGGNMIKESLETGDSCPTAGLDVKTMFIMAVATSIDALAVGITFALTPVKIADAVGKMGNTLIAVGAIGVITFLMSCIGVKIGNVFGVKYKSRAELAGGIILVGIGIKILVESLI